jgi:hypothetical protein
MIVALMIDLFDDDRLAEAGGSGAPTAIIVVVVIVPSVRMCLLAAVQALRRYLWTRPMGHSPMLS